MFYYLKGTITSFEHDSIILDVNNVGYQLFVSKQNLYTQGLTVKFYIYTVFKQDGQYFVGFSDIEERKLFLSLIKVNGIGPKSALTILRNASVEELKKAIEKSDAIQLKKISGVSLKTASQIVLDLNKNSNPSIKKDLPYQNVINALKQMGFKQKTITTAIKKVDISNLVEEEALKAVLQIIRKVS